MAQILINYPDGINVWGTSVEFSNDEQFIRDWTPHAFQIHLETNHAIENKMAIGISLLWQEPHTWETRRTGYEIPHSRQECVDKLVSLGIKDFHVVVKPQAPS